MGGFTQVGSHGSGATVPPVDEQVVSMKLVTPAKGCLELSQVSPCPALPPLPWTNLTIQLLQTLSISA